ncbi:MAG TPA: flavin reductase family protein [Candidatus Saccharimonadales bacterium]|nr:flavin reductase family protein [Candidatus Saccharimonadales bacterium]
MTQKIHRILAPRLVVMIGTTSEDGRKNIIPINNITSISTDPGLCLIAVHYPWITTKSLKTAKGFTVSVPAKDQLDLIWKLGQKYSGYQSSQEKIEEFAGQLDMSFSAYGPVLKNALGWIECGIVDRPKDVGGNHLMVIGKYIKAAINDQYFTQEISPKNNPEPIMQWEGNNFSAAGEVFSIDYFKDPETAK